MANLRDQLEALVKALEAQTKESEEARKKRDGEKAEKKISDAVSKILNFGKSFENFMKPVMQFQTSMTSMGRSLDGTMKNVLGGSLPLQIRMTSTMALLKAGLEGNSASLGKFVMRAQALGENINMLATGFRDIRTSLGLTTGQLGELGTYVVDSARTYKVSSDQLVKSMADLSKKMAVLGFAGAGSSMKALADAVAQTALVAPGGVAQVLGPMMSGGIETIATAQMSGMQGFLTRLTNNQVTSSQEIFSALQGFVNRIDQTIKPSLSQGPQVANTLLQQLYGINFETYNTMKVMVDSFRSNPQQERIAASLDEAKTLLNQIAPRIEEPLALIAGYALSLIELISPIFPVLMSILTGMAAANTVRLAMRGIASTTNLLLTKSMQASLANSGMSNLLGKFSAFLGPIAGMVTGVMLLVDLFGSTDENIDEMNEREKRKDLPSIEEINRQTQTMAIASIGNIMAASMRMGTVDTDDKDFQIKMMDALTRSLAESNTYLKTIVEKSQQIPLPSGGSPLGP